MTKETAAFVLGFLITVLSLTTQGRAFGQVSKPSGRGENTGAGATPIRLETFDIVWRTVRDKLFDPNLRGVDWQAVRRQYEPRLGDLKTDEEFHDLLDNKVRAAISSMNNIAGLIIDLRGNSGGLLEVAAAIAGLLVSKDTSLGYIQKRKGTEHIPVHPRKNPYQGRVVILVDEMSLSASELFAGGLQENGRATVIGETSQGSIVVADFKELPTGKFLIYPIGDFRTPKGVVLEGRGVVPDREVKLTRETLLRGVDLQLEEAVDFLKGEASLASHDYGVSSGSRLEPVTLSHRK